jgi:hypothetical protein
MLVHGILDTLLAVVEMEHYYVISRGFQIQQSWLQLHRTLCDMAIIIFMLGIMHADMAVLHNVTFWLKDDCTYHVRGLQVQQSFLRHNRTLSNIVRILEIMDTDVGSFQHGTLPK